MSLQLRSFFNSILKYEKCRILCVRYNSSESSTIQNNPIDITSVDETPKFVEQYTEVDEEEIMRKRNKSQLNIGDRNILNDLPPYNEDLTDAHATIRYKRRMLGRYGMKGLRDVSVGALWPLPEEIDDKLEYERVLNPKTIQENWAIIAERNQQAAEKIRIRDETVAMKMEKAEQWKSDFYAKIAKKEAEVAAAKLAKERLIEDVRRQFGFKIDPRDARFKEALEKKEKEDKKRRKEAKKNEKSARFMARLIAKSNPETSTETQAKTTEKVAEEKKEE